MDYPSELVKGSIIPLVLSLLREREMYGYQMVKALDARSGGKLTFKEGTLYPTLHRLESDGLIEGDWKEEPGEKPRKYYALTAKGRKEQTRLADQYREYQSLVISFLKLAGGREVSHG